MQGARIFNFFFRNPIFPRIQLNPAKDLDLVDSFKHYNKFFDYHLDFFANRCREDKKKSFSGCIVIMRLQLFFSRRLHVHAHMHTARHTQRTLAQIKYIISMPLVAHECTLEHMCMYSFSLLSLPYFFVKSKRKQYVCATRSANFTRSALSIQGRHLLSKSFLLFTTSCYEQGDQKWTLSFWKPAMFFFLLLCNLWFCVPLTHREKECLT